MLTLLRRKTRNALDRLWVRITVISVLSLLAIGVARIARPLLPTRISETFGTDSVNDLLTIIASSMLAVVTFSLSVMVNVYRSASSQWTPRVHRLMLEDRTTQNTLATFVGAYIFALASIVLLRTNLFANDDEEADPQVVLFAFTVVVLVLIVVSIVKWILHLQRVGSLTDIAERIEERTSEEFEQRMNSPCLGGHPLRAIDDIPSDAIAVVCERTGYVQRVYASMISDAAEEHGVDVYLHRHVGEFVHRDEPLCYVSRTTTEIEATLRHNIVVDGVRTFEQDPRFGLIVLGEVGSKAMSPGINDPGTAIDVIGRMARILEGYRSEMDEAAAEDVPHPRIWVPPLAASDLVRDGFDPIGRDGATTIEVQIVLQRALASLSGHPETVLAEAALDSAARGYRRAMREMNDDDDRQRLSDAVTERVRRSAGVASSDGS